MLGNLICWVIALATIFASSTDRADLYTKMLIAMGFIFLGILSKAVDVYRDTHSNKDKPNT